MCVSVFRPHHGWARSFGVAMVVLLGAAGGVDAQAQQGAGAVAWPAAIHAGTCADLASDPIHRLTDVRLGGGLNEDDDDDGNDQTGQAGGIGSASVVPVAFSETEIDDRVDVLVQQPHVVVIGDSATGPGRFLACGEIGGYPVDDDDTAFGLIALNGSGYHGIAVLDGNDDDNGVAVRLYLAAPGSMVSAETGATGTTDPLPGDDDDDDGGDD